MLLRSTMVTLFAIGFAIYCLYLIDRKYGHIDKHHTWDTWDKNR